MPAAYSSLTVPLSPTFFTQPLIALEVSSRFHQQVQNMVIRVYLESEQMRCTGNQSLAYHPLLAGKWWRLGGKFYPSSVYSSVQSRRLSLPGGRQKTAGLGLCETNPSPDSTSFSASLSKNLTTTHSLTFSHLLPTDLSNSSLGTPLTGPKRALNS